MADQVASNGYGYTISGAVQEMPSGMFIANALAVRTWEHFAVQRARLTSVAFKTRVDAEAHLQRLLEDLKSIFPAGEAGV
jgi:hypothetical protein